MPVQPLEAASSARYSCAMSPIEAAFTRSGRSFETSTTSAPSAARFAATARMRLSPSVPRMPDGSVEVSTWLSSTRTVPCAIGIGWSRRPCATRRSSRTRSACRANQPSSGWSRLPSSSLTTTSGSTTSCSSKRASAPGSDSRTDVSSTKVFTRSSRRACLSDRDRAAGPGAGPFACRCAHRASRATDGLPAAGTDGRTRPTPWARATPQRQATSAASARGVSCSSSSRTNSPPSSSHRDSSRSPST